MRTLKYLLSFILLIGPLAFLSSAGTQARRSVSALAGSDPVIAAAGDIACDPASSNFNGGNGTANHCRQKYTSDLLVNAGLAAVLPLGDIQYYCGGYQAFLQSYDLSWGRVKNITRPTVGNHEYLTSGGTDCTIANEGATGYFNYFGAAAGEPGKGYYSYDIGTWHLIALNSNCTDVGGCGPTSPQGTWLAADLAAHQTSCTLAYWHIPFFSSGGRAENNSRELWRILYDNDVDVVLNGHDHIYERFAPQTPDGTLDLARGIRQFTVGNGGANLTDIPFIAANSEVRNNDTYGVLKLTLHPTSYDWEFVPEAGKTFRDSGTGNCHGIMPGPMLFSDNFETGTLSRWTSVRGLVVQSQDVAGGSYAARATSAAGGATYARKSLATAQTDLYYRVRFKVISQGANTVNLIKLRSNVSTALLSVSINQLGQLSYRNDVTGTSVNSTVNVSQGNWHTLQVRLRIAGASSQVDVWLNEVPVSALSRADSFGLNPIGVLQLGENTSGLTYDIVFDDVVAFPGGSGPAPTPTRTPTPIPMPTVTYADVPREHWAWQYVETIHQAGITGGCGNGKYCPSAPVTRAQMAVFLLRARHGSSYVPPAARGNVFDDVPRTYWAAAWIERLAKEGITAGCADAMFCPDAPVTRDQMAVFLLRAKHGSSYVPPSARGTIFDDVPRTYWAARWIERLVAEGISAGCAPDLYCPAQIVTRDQMAVLLVRTFSLP